MENTNRRRNKIEACIALKHLYSLEENPSIFILTLSIPSPLPQTLYLFQGLLWSEQVVPIVPQSQGRGCPTVWPRRLESDTHEAHNESTASQHYNHCWSPVEKNKTSSFWYSSYCISQIHGTTKLIPINWNSTILYDWVSFRDMTNTGFAELHLSTLWCLLWKLQDIKWSYNRPAVMNPILAVKSLCDLLYWSN